MKICSIVVLYEPKKNEINNILSYSNYVDYVFIYDNSRNDNGDNIVKVLGHYRKYTYKHFSENVGLCKALNFGMTEAKNNNFEWALLMDSDSYLLSNVIKVYKEFIKTEQNNMEAVLAPVHIFDRSNNLGYDGYKKIKWAMTSGCLYNIEIFESLGGFKEDLYIDGLDMDYCYKARKNGYEVHELGKALIQHYPGETRNIKIGNRVVFKYGYASPLRYYMQARALVWMILEYKSLADVLMYFYKWFKAIFFFDNKREYIKQLRRGSIDGKNLWNESR